MRIGILGAGAWGTALAVHAASRHSVRLWSRDADVIADLRNHRANRRYLPGVAIPDQVEGEASLEATAADADLLVIATAVAGLRPVLHSLGRQQWRGAGVVWLSKGLEADTGLLPHQVLEAVLPGCAGGALTGPSFAVEVAAGKPVALTAAATWPWLSQRMVDAFHHGAMRVYQGDDLVGAEIGGALKNIMAIATGISDGLGLGLNARAALLTRGLAEITRFGLAHGARPETFQGLAGVGDLVLTCTGDLSRNRKVGLQLAAGQPLPDILAGLGHVAEGVPCCRAVVARARQAGVDMPISEAVLAVIDGQIDAARAVAALISREPRREGE